MVVDFEPAGLETCYQLAKENVLGIVVLRIQRGLEIPAVHDRCYGFRLLGLTLKENIKY